MDRERQGKVWDQQTLKGQLNLKTTDERRSRGGTHFFKEVYGAQQDARMGRERQMWG